jgi:hypothetical protein
MVNSSNFMVFFFPFPCGDFQSHRLESVYGIVFLQIFEAFADSLSTYYQEAGGGWSQPYIFNPITIPLMVSVFGNLPILMDALSEPRISLYSQKNNAPYSWIFCAAVLHMENPYIFQALFWDQDKSSDVCDLCLHIPCELSAYFITTLILTLSY